MINTNTADQAEIFENFKQKFQVNAENIKKVIFSSPFIFIFFQFNLKDWFVS